MQMVHHEMRQPNFVRTFSHNSSKFRGHSQAVGPDLYVVASGTVILNPGEQHLAPEVALGCLESIAAEVAGPLPLINPCQCYPFIDAETVGSWPRSSRSRLRSQ